MPEHGLSVSFDKMSFRCVVEYISGAGEDVETLRYTKNYPTKYIISNFIILTIPGLCRLSFPL